MPRRELNPGSRGPQPDRLKAVSVRKAALDFLCVVDHYESKALPYGRPDNRLTAEQASAVDRSTVRSVGLSYGEILDRLREQFPAAATTVGCLRWYCSQVRDESPLFEEGHVLPQRRPRAPPRRAAEIRRRQIAGAASTSASR
jgi:hypothetical protein